MLSIDCGVATQKPDPGLLPGYRDTTALLSMNAKT